MYLLGTKFVVKTDNVANTFFKTQWKLSPQQVRWQEFLAEYDFLWEYKSGRHNQVDDALSRKKVFAVVYSITRLEADFLDKIKSCTANESLHVKTINQVREGTIIVPYGDGLHRELLKETHDTFLEVRG